MFTYEVSYSPGTQSAKFDLRDDALRDFRSAVVSFLPCAVWEIPTAGGEMRCIASFPGIER